MDISTRLLRIGAAAALAVATIALPPPSLDAAPTCTHAPPHSEIIERSDPVAAAAALVDEIVCSPPTEAERARLARNLAMTEPATCDDCLIATLIDDRYETRLYRPTWRGLQLALVVRFPVQTGDEKLPVVMRGHGGSGLSFADVIGEEPFITQFEGMVNVWILTRGERLTQLPTTIDQRTLTLPGNPSSSTRDDEIAPLFDVAIGLLAGDQRPDVEHIMTYGSSRGGQLAWRLMTERSELVSFGVANATPVSAWSPAVARALARHAAICSGPTHNASACERLATPPDCPPTGQDCPWPDWSSRTIRNAWLDVVDAVEREVKPELIRAALLRSDFVGRLGDLPDHVQMHYGAADPVVTVAHAEALIEALPANTGGQVVTVHEGVGHRQVGRAAAAQVADAIAAWLDRGSWAPDGE